MNWSGPLSLYADLDSPSLSVNSAVFANSYTGAGPAAGVWSVVDLTERGVPQDAVAAFLSGILIITYAGPDQGGADLQVFFRRLGDTATQDIDGQAVEAKTGNGIRSTMSTWVPLVDGKFEWKWTRSTTAQWPNGPSYGVNLNVQAWAR